MTTVNFKTTQGFDLTNTSEQGASIRPSLLLNFAKTRQLDPRITFARDSIGTYFDRNSLLKTATANQARFDHNPATKQSLGLLIEEPSTNYTIQSNDISLNTTNLNATVTGNNAVSPEGMSNAGTVLATAGNAQHGVQKSSNNLPASTTCTLSAFVKAGTHRYTRIDTANVGNWSTNAGMAVDLLTGQIIAGSGSVQDVGNGWYRISIQGVTNSNAGVSRGVWVWAAGSDGNSTFNAVGTETILVYGLQIEALPFVTSYIPTGAASVTRQTDSAIMFNANVRQWFREDEGTFFTVGVFNVTLPAGNFGSVWDAWAFSGAQFKLIYNPTNVAGFYVINFGVAVADLSSTASGAYIPSIRYRHAASYRYADYAQAINGTVTSNTNSSVMPANITRFYIGSNGGSVRGSQTIEQIRYFSSKIPNAELQTLTRE
jgi:hypothetical protein